MCVFNDSESNHFSNHCWWLIHRFSWLFFPRASASLRTSLWPWWVRALWVCWRLWRWPGAAIARRSGQICRGTPWQMVGKWLANGWQMVGKWLANGWYSLLIVYDSLSMFDDVCESLFCYIGPMFWGRCSFGGIDWRLVKRYFTMGVMKTYCVLSDPTCGAFSSCPRWTGINSVRMHNWMQCRAKL